MSYRDKRLDMRRLLIGDGAAVDSPPTEPEVSVLGKGTSPPVCRNGMSDIAAILIELPVQSGGGVRSDGVAIFGVDLFRQCQLVSKWST